MIDKFDGEYRWLSNFWPCQIVVGEEVYPSVEHAYQAAKSVDADVRRHIASLTAGQAKRYARTVTLRENWEQRKVPIMRMLLEKKFSPGSELAQKLQATGDVPLIEGNTWGDTFWGVCKGVGQNYLGKLLMEIRKELK